MKIVDVKTHFNNRLKELFEQHFSMDGHMEEVLGRKIKNQTDEEEASLLLMLKLIKVTVEELLLGKKIYRLEQRVSAQPIIDNLLNLKSANEEKRQKIIDEAPQTIGVIITGIFTEEGGFVGKFQYEEQFATTFIEPVNRLFADSEKDLDGIRCDKILAQLVKETHVVSSPEELSLFPPDVREMKLFNDKGELVTESFAGFKSFLNTQTQDFSRDKLFDKIYGVRQDINDLENDGDSANSAPYKPL